MNRTLTIAILIAAQGIATCALAAPKLIPAPLMDESRINHATFDRDLGQCRDIAEGAIHPNAVDQDASTSRKLKQRVVGIAKAGVKTVEKTGLNVLEGAPTFVREVTGSGSGARGRAIVSACMKGRGYPVLE